MSKKKAMISLLMLLLMVCSVSAQAEQVTIQAQNAGILPGNLLYGLDRALERITLALTMNKETRAEKHLSYAMERLAEMEAVAEEPELVTIAEEGLEDSIAELEAETDTLPARERLMITERFRLHLEQFKARVEVLPIQAQTGIRTAIQSQEIVLVRLQEGLPPGLQESPDLRGVQVLITPEELREAKKNRG